jgi:prolipoprotein diacylglyceryl transferase
MIGYFYWDPSRAIVPWDIPLLGRPILWYGFLFALGFFLSYLVLFELIKDRRDHPKKIADVLTLYAVLGAVIGARIFDILFYENWHQILHDPLSVFRVWEGGLASHGGVLGILVAFAIFQRRYRYFSNLELLDLAVIPAGLAAAFIRIGNFFNQEILGTSTNVPWAVVFGHPADGSFPIPRHPVQLYEAIFYLAVFGVMWSLRKWWKKAGKATGCFLLLVFGFRFLIEFLKEEQSAWLAHFPLTMGQLLSIPFIVLGSYLFFRKS